MKIVWLSANLFGFELLKEAMKIKEANIVGIITLDKRAKIKMYDGVKENDWHYFKAPVYKLKNINECFEVLKKILPDMIIMCGWRQIIDKKILDIPKKGFIGFHPTLLPKGRGAAPIINSILEGFKKSGVTMYYVNNTLDGGDVIGQKSFKIKDDDYAQDVYKKVVGAGQYLIKMYLPRIISDNAPRVIQREEKASYFKKRSLKENRIDLESNPEEIYRKIRALSKPYNGAYLKLGNKKIGKEE